MVVLAVVVHLVVAPALEIHLLQHQVKVVVAELV
jgi:hypothetical protein